MKCVTILSTANFDSAVWTNKQNIAVRLAERGVSVTYVESMGLRRPTLSRSDLTRVAEKMQRKPRKPLSARQDLTIVSPKVIPFHGNPMTRSINRRLVSRQFAGTVPAGSVLWTFSPHTYGLEDIHEKVIYHAVDLLHEVPGIARGSLLQAERHLLDMADHVIASSSGVEAHLIGMGAKDVLLWENVGDSSTTQSDSSLREPSAVFAGNLTPTKVDFRLILELANSGVNIKLAGPLGIDGAGTDSLLGLLFEHPRVEYVGNMTPSRLGALLNTATVGIIPYHLNSYTSGVFPMKVYEYLSAGLSVVSTPLPSLHSVAGDKPDIVLASPANFVQEVRSRLPVDSAVVLRCRRQARGHSWDDRINDIDNLLWERGAL